VQEVDHPPVRAWIVLVGQVEGRLRFGVEATVHYARKAQQVAWGMTITPQLPAILEGRSTPRRERTLSAAGDSDRRRIAPMVPIRFRVVGEEDYALDIEIDGDGSYVVNSGTYTTDKPRSGKLTAEREQELLEAIESLGIPREHPMPEGAEAFQAHLIIGPEGEEVHYPFWEGALEEDEPLRRVVRLIERI
jgi:hypothetical protein